MLHDFDTLFAYSKKKHGFIFIFFNSCDIPPIVRF